MKTAARRQTDFHGRGLLTEQFIFLRSALSVTQASAAL
jgi:hypothetical protein